jgi:hypothetical protein
MFFAEHPAKRTTIKTIPNKNSLFLILNTPPMFLKTQEKQSFSAHKKFYKFFWD